MPTIEETTRYFDTHADRLQASRLVDKSAALRALIFDRIPAGAAVLEVGAGTGLYTRRLLADGHHVTAVDLSTAGLEQIRAQAEASGDAERLSVLAGAFPPVVAELAPSSFDCVLFIKVLHHFPDLHEVREAFRRAYDLLAPGGRILIFEPNGSYPLWPVVLLSRGLDHFRNERNVLLMKRRLLQSALDGLQGARVQCRYRFVVPGGIASRVPLLGRLDAVLCDERFHPFEGRHLLDKLAVNIAFDVEKQRL